MTLTIDGFSVDLAHHPGDNPEFVISTANGRHFSVPKSVYDVLADTTRPVDESTRAIIARFQESSDRAKSLLRAGFWLRVPLISARTMARAADAGAHAFREPWWPLMLALGVGGAAGCAIVARRSHPVSAVDFVLGYAVAYAFAFVHELGHASALRFSGAKPGAVGFAMYLIFPALYSDVTETWRLPKWRRVLVDAGGVYFQALAFMVCFIGTVMTGWAAWSFAALITGVSIVTNANPVLRFDGYWAMRDLLGVTRPWQLLRRRADGSKPSLLVAAGALFLCAFWIAYLGFTLRTVVLMLSQIVPTLRWALHVH